ncbi:hypothetical protein [Streptomyces sp. NPDC048644]|uniref:hypothetical protein n=1 Tax=Streptomyces sp. NPDC048644 TaxID=3365582 RepID=UPI0037143733
MIINISKHAAQTPWHRGSHLRPREPGCGLPSAADVTGTYVTCTYVTDWATAELRWKLTDDRAELKALRRTAVQCPAATVTFTSAP